MSELQITLLVVGAVVIAAVIIYNRVQEARFRRRTERAFAPSQGDALLTPRAEEAGAGRRIEPQLPQEPESAEWVSGGRQEPRAPPAPAAPAPALAPAAGESPIDYVADIESNAPLPAAALQGLLSTLGPLASRVRLLAPTADRSGWVECNATAPGEVRRVRVALQLADRRGALGAQELSAFQSAVAVCAAGVSASATIPETAPAVEKARELDEFCADVDVVVGINVVAQGGKLFGGTKLRGVAEAAGFRLTDSGVFSFTDADGRVLFTLENGDQSRFTSEGLRHMTTNSLTLLLDVPRQPDGVRVFDQMVAAGRQLATALGGALVDDNRVPVSQTGLEQIRSQLRSIYGQMQARGITPGGPEALRLFA
jgi:FtsZ-interacting cell division protein ZipA